jgi:hypothetical protein
MSQHQFRLRWANLDGQKHLLESRSKTPLIDYSAIVLEPLRLEALERLRYRRFDCQPQLLPALQRRGAGHIPRLLSAPFRDGPSPSANLSVAVRTP